MKILSLDQSTTNTGYAIFDFNSKTLLEHGVLPSGKKDPYRENRVYSMASKIRELAEQYGVEVVSFEDIYIDRLHLTSLVILGMLAGSIVQIFKDEDMLVFPVVASAWKSYCGVTAKKRPEQKLQTQEFVKNEFELETVTEDEADAIAQGWYVINNVQIG